MKFKNKTFLGLFSGFTVTVISATLVSASYSISAPNKLNSLYATLTFTSKDPDVTFSGNTIVKLRKGKKFGSIIPPVAMKPNSKFKNWVIYVEEQEVVVDPSFVITEENMIITPTFEIIGERSHVMFESSGDCDFVSGLRELDVESGIIFDNIPKPRVKARNPEAYVIGWRDEEYNMLTPDTVINKNMVIWPVVENRLKLLPGAEKPVDLSMTLNFTATSDNASVTWVREGDYGKGRNGIGIIPDYVDMDNFRVQNDDERVHEPIAIPKGHSVSIVGGPFYGVRQGEFTDVAPFSMNPDNYSHFVITGDVWVSGSINGLLNNGQGPQAWAQVDDLTKIGEKGEYIFYKLFANADKENPNAHLHISQNINSQDYPFLGSCTLSANCYANMFEGCNMSSIPYTLLAPYDDVLSADEPSAQLILMSESYSQMFLNCPKIKSIPDELFHPRPNDPSPICGWDVGRVYYGMFSNCIGLNTLSPNLFQYITLEGNELIANMFSNCINLKIYDEKCSYESVLIIGKARLREGFKIPGVFEGCLCFGFDGTIIGGHNYYVGI